MSFAISAIEDLARYALENAGADRAATDFLSSAAHAGADTATMEAASDTSLSHTLSDYTAHLRSSEVEMSAAGGKASHAPGAGERPTVSNHTERPAEQKYKTTARSTISGIADDPRKSYPGVEVNPKHLDVMRATPGLKFSEDRLIATTRVGGNGQVVYLEQGWLAGETPPGGATVRRASGFEHILELHESHFERNGISRERIPETLMNALEENQVVNTQGRGEDRKVYRTVFDGVEKHVAIQFSDKGFVIGANPQGSLPTIGSITLPGGDVDYTGYESV